jgi:hypothetical protein
MGIYGRDDYIRQKKSEFQLNLLPKIVFFSHGAIPPPQNHSPLWEPLPHREVSGSEDSCHFMTA